MKARRIALVTAAVLTIFVLILNSCPYVDMYHMEDSYHEYGYWNSMIDAMMGQAPAKTMKVPLVQCPDKKDKLCYAYYPTHIEFAKYIALCVADTSNMNLRTLYEIVENHHHK